MKILVLHFFFSLIVACPTFAQTVPEKTEPNVDLDMNMPANSQQRVTKDSIKTKESVTTEDANLRRDAPLREVAKFKSEDKTSAIAELKSVGGSKAQGQLLLKETPDGVKITGRLSGLAPNTTHGFHIHEFGDCSAKDATSAGGHFNPTKKPHGDPSLLAHAGDLGNLQADAQGLVQVDQFVKGVTLGSGKQQIVGKSFIVHEKTDDLKTQPSGDSGSRIACGVITKTSHPNTETLTQ